MLASEFGSCWHNFRTGEYEYLSEVPTERMHDYIPQYPPAQMLYQLHRKLGKTELEAAREVLQKVTEVHAEEGTRQG